MSEAITKAQPSADFNGDWLLREVRFNAQGAVVDWRLPAQPAPAPQPAVPDDGDFFALDDEAKAMIVNSHHYTPENIQALIEQLTAFSDPTKTTQADWDNLDWRGFCNVIQRVMMGLACDLQPAVPVVEAFAEGWRMAADWANRDDLLPDMDSPQYAKERDERLAELRPAVEPMTPLHLASVYAVIDSMGWDLDDQEKDDMVDLVRATEKRHGITAKAEDAHQPTKEAEKP